VPSRLEACFGFVRAPKSSNGPDRDRLDNPSTQSRKKPVSAGERQRTREVRGVLRGAKKFQPAQWASCIIRVAGWGYQMPAPGRQELPTLAKSLQNLGR